MQVSEEGKYILPLFPSKIIPYSNNYSNFNFNNFNNYDKNDNEIKYNSNILNNKKKKKRKSKRRKKNLKYFRDKARSDLKNSCPSTNKKFPSIYSIRPSYKFTHSPSASKTRYCDCC